MNADEKRKFLKDVLHTMRTSFVSQKELYKVADILGVDTDLVMQPAFVISDAITRYLNEDAKVRAQAEHRRKDDNLALSDPRVYNKGVLDALQVVARLERAAEAKHFSSDARLLGEVCDELTDLLRRPSREETTRYECRGTGCGGACSTPKIGQVYAQKEEVHRTPKERVEAKHQPPHPPTKRVEQTLHERLLDFGHHFDVQLMFFTDVEAQAVAMQMYPAAQGWVIDPTCWQRKTANGTINVRIVYRQVVQP